MRVFEADKTKPFSFVCMLVSYHLRLHEGWKMAEGSGQYFISHIITQITTEYPEIIWNKECCRVYLQTHTYTHIHTRAHTYLLGSQSSIEGSYHTWPPAHLSLALSGATVFLLNFKSCLTLIIASLAIICTVPLSKRAARASLRSSACVGGLGAICGFAVCTALGGTQ